MADLLQINQTFDESDVTVGMLGPGWYGSCSVVSGGYSGQGLEVGTDGGVNVVAPYPRADMVVPATYEECWEIEFKFMVTSIAGCTEQIYNPNILTLMTLGSMDRDDKLKIQMTPDGYLQVYPYKSTTLINTCNWTYVKIKVWDTYFNVYINHTTNPFLQYGIPNFDPYWKRGDNRIKLTFPVDGLHKLVIDDFKFTTTATQPSDAYIAAGCYAIRDAQNNPAARVPVFLVSATAAANQVTDSYGRFTVTDIPGEVDAFIVYPDLRTAILTASDIALSKQRRLISGADDLCNVILDSDGDPVAAARIYYVNTKTASFYTDSEGKFPKTSVPEGYNVFIKTDDNHTLYLDSTLFSN